MPVQKFKFQKTKESEVKENEAAEVVAEKSVEQLVGKLEQQKLKMPFNFKFILRSKISLNKDNNYQQKDIEKLAKSILDYGLLHNIEGLYDEDNDIYILESGERRTRALDYLLDKYKGIEESDPDYERFMENVKGYENGYPMNVKRKKEELPPESEEAKLQELDSRIRLHAANQEIRSEEPDERLRNITEYKQLLEEKNRLMPKQQRVNVNKTIAELEGISERQVQKYNNVAKLIPELQEEFSKNNITLNEGSSYAQLSEEDQRVLVDLIEKGQKVNVEELKKLKDTMESSQAEVQERQKQIELLEKERDQLLQGQEAEIQSLKDSFQSQENEIRKRIELEFQENNPDKKKIEKLELELKELQRLGNIEVNEALKDLEHKEQEIQKLRTELKAEKEMKQSENILDEKKLESARLEARVSLQLDQIKRYCDEFLKLVSDNDSYKKDLQKLLKKYV